MTNQNEMTVKLTLTTEMLAMSSGNKEILEEFIASKAATATDAQEEIEATIDPDAVDKSSTVFPTDENGIFVWDYQVRGYLKSALKTLIETDAEVTVSKWAAAKAVDKFLFVRPRRIYFQDQSGASIKAPDGVNQRPLRATTLQGERICLARSEFVAVGRVLEFRIIWLGSRVAREGKRKTVGKSDIAVFEETLVRKMLDVGELAGIGRWNGGGFGCFSYEAK